MNLCTPPRPLPNLCTCWALQWLPTQGEALSRVGDCGQDWQCNTPHLISLQAEAGGMSLVPQPAATCLEAFDSQDVPPFELLVPVHAKNSLGCLALCYAETRNGSILS